jgi:hypothetical protein
LDVWLLGNWSASVWFPGAWFGSGTSSFLKRRKSATLEEVSAAWAQLAGGLRSIQP